MSLDSPWTHAICDRCWNKTFRDLRGDPTRVVFDEREMEICCFCRGFCGSGIYVRNDPTDQNMKCGGQHD